MKMTSTSSTIPQIVIKPVINERPAPFLSPPPPPRPALASEQNVGRKDDSPFLEDHVPRCKKKGEHGEDMTLLAVVAVASGGEKEKIRSVIKRRTI